jgi:hypothetical protein
MLWHILCLPVAHFVPSRGTWYDGILFPLVKNCKSRIASQELQVKNCKSRIASQELQVKNCKSRIASQELQVKNCKSRIASQELQVKNCKSRIASQELQVKNCKSRIAKKSFRQLGHFFLAERIFSLVEVEVDKTETNF